jgi:CheY-like chemotaxis protein
MVTKILIVDDDSVTRKNLSELLKGFGHDVLTVRSGELAIKKVKKEDFDLALVDLKMPKMDGIDVLKAIKSLKPHLYVIIITAYASIETAIEAMKLGAFDYIRKPFKVKEINTLINNVIDEDRFEKSLVGHRLNRSEKSLFDIFCNELKRKKGIVFTIEDQEILGKKYNLSGTQLYMITASKKGKKYIKPNELDKMKRLVDSFMKKEGESVVLIHGMELLIKHNPRKVVTDFLAKLKEYVDLKNSTLIVSASSQELEEEAQVEIENILTGNYTQQMSESLANPIRRAVLRYLTTVNKASFTQILKNINERDSAKFSFHIKKLSAYDVIEKDEKGIYSLTKRGNNLLLILNDIDGESKKESKTLFVINSS